jgi:hypothetical protein
MARAVAAEVRTFGAGAGLQLRPLAVAELAGLGGFTLVEADLGLSRGGYRGLLQAIRGGFRLCVDGRAADGGAISEATVRRRARFVVAHEIAHSFFFEQESIRPRRLFPVGSDVEEAWCNEFARALLLPPSAVREAEPSPQDALRLSDEWDVSVEVAARAMAEWHGSRPFVALGYSRSASAPVEVQWAGGADVSDPSAVGRAMLSTQGTYTTAIGLRAQWLPLPERRQAIAIALLA